MLLLNTERTRDLLRVADFRTLFIELLGWDRLTQRLDVSVDGKTHQLSAIAHKRGVVAFECPATDGALPLYPIRRKIDQQTTKTVREHIIIYTDPSKSTQIWQWVKREPGKPTACREHTYHKNQPGDALIQKLQGIAFTIEEEEKLTLPDAAGRMRQAFDVEKVTKKFYDRFKNEHDAFLEFIKGIPDEELQRWYASVMLNRLMFIYFIQKKGFLDGNRDYLRIKLDQSREQGKDKFYKDFLCPLFFEGFAKKAEDRSATVNKLLGKVPYLNGGLFLKHQIEEQHAKIAVPDVAFEKLFDFFDQYHWHLDERPVRADNEINPDVLGYIFEKYINQKQMGAYYTKEDITEYISKNTVIPYLFDVARYKCKIAFEGDNSVWRLLQVDPDKYIYDAVKKGVELPLPAEIAKGLDDVSKRTEWNKPASEEFALPTEIWREVVARRKRYEEVRTKLINGEIRDINDFITFNLDIRQFAEDVIENSEGPELLRAFYHAIEKVTVLDPTCGSGAFLFAALNILESLYEACLDRMEAFLSELERSGEKHRPEKYSDFKKILDQVEKHPNRKYFIYKSIIVNNLYGVDIMEEAIEICKLRLFLKLVAQVESAERIEPLPDIDFNIRAGNTLVGYATYEEVKKAVTSKFDFDNTMEKIEEQARDIDRLFKLFHQQQTEIGVDVTAESKQELRKRLKKLEDELNRYLATEYGVELRKKTAVEHWLKSHQPFHWFIEFFGIINGGGFNIIIGNPPYVELTKVSAQYQPRNFITEPCGNLYALCIERSFTILDDNSRFGFIVQQPITSTTRMAACRKAILNGSSYVWSSTFDDRPSKLFDGMHHARLAIILSKRKHECSEPTSLSVTSYNKWYKEERTVLFQRLHYAEVSQDTVPGVFPKISTAVEASIASKLQGCTERMDGWISRTATPHKLYYKITGVGSWFTITTRPPRFFRDGKDSSSTRESEINLQSKEVLDLAFCAVNSTLFYWFYQVRTNCRDFNPSDYKHFPIPKTVKSQDMAQLAKELGILIDSSAEFVEAAHSLTGNIKYEQFRPRVAKPIIDEIDRVLAKHYGFTDEELDFIINYDIKYRMGREGNVEDQ